MTSQTFIIKYKNTSQATANNVIITDQDKTWDIGTLEPGGVGEVVFERIVE